MWTVISWQCRKTCAKAWPQIRSSRNMRNQSKLRPILPNFYAPPQVPEFKHLLKPIFFTGFFCTGAMTTGFLWKYERMKYEREARQNPIMEYFRNLKPHDPYQAHTKVY